jgi:Bacterial Ig domain
LQETVVAVGNLRSVRRHLQSWTIGVALTIVALALPATALAGAVITPVPTFPYPSVTLGKQFDASITLFNNSTGQEAGAGVTVTASNLDLFPSCPDSVITSNNCPTAETGVFSLSSTGTSGAGECPAGTWTIAEAAPGRFRFTPPATIGLLAGHSCTVTFNATASKLPQFDSDLTAPGSQTNQVASVDAFSPVSSLTVRNSGSGQTTVLGAPSSGGVAAANASLQVSEGCRRVVTAKVTGPDIASVTFLVDGKRQATVNKAPFKTTIKAFKLSRGHHRLTAQVTFTQGSGDNPSPAKFQGGFLRCAPPKQPNFTG